MACISVQALADVGTRARPAHFTQLGTRSHICPGCVSHSQSCNSECDVKTHLYFNHYPREGQRIEGPQSWQLKLWFLTVLTYSGLRSYLDNQCQTPTTCTSHQPENCPKHRELDPTLEGSLGEGVTPLRGVLRITAHDERWGPRGLVEGMQKETPRPPG